jgi:transposase InsO family protein
MLAMKRWGISPPPRISQKKQIEGFLEDEGIKHEFSSPYTPQQNGGGEEE